MWCSRYLLLLLVFIVSSPVSFATAKDGDARLTVGFPTYVYHPDNRSAREGWNEGWFHNEGVIVDLSWPAYSFGTVTDLRVGVTGGVFDNSIYNTSVFFGGMVEIEVHATDHLALSLGSYVGGITGYDTSPAPAIAPYVGIAYGLTENFELGLREFWLPAKSVGGEELARSDAYVLAVTVGSRF